MDFCISNLIYCENDVYYLIKWCTNNKRLDNSLDATLTITIAICISFRSMFTFEFSINVADIYLFTYCFMFRALYHPASADIFYI